MNKFYLRVNTSKGIANFVIRHESVKNEKEATERFVKKHNFEISDIISVSQKKPETNYSRISPSSVRQLIFDI